MHWFLKIASPDKIIFFYFKKAFLTIFPAKGSVLEFEI